MTLSKIFLFCLIHVNWAFFVANAHTKGENEFRDYEHNAPEHVKNFYKENHTKQTLDFVLQQKAKYRPLDKKVMSVWEAFEQLNTLVDESDPDLDLPQIYHAFQTAQAMRKDDQPRWLILTGFIHDLGKVLTLFDEPQWATVGDTFPVGCAYSNKVIFYDYFANNPDWNSTTYQQECGIYNPGCGLKNVHMSWGHDEYLYYVMKNHLPEEALYIIRYHSFYALHKENEYQHLLDDYDKKMLPWLKLFQQYDLYSKSEEKINIEKLYPYYKKLVAEFLPAKLNW